MEHNTAAIKPDSLKVILEDEKVKCVLLVSQDTYRQDCEADELVRGCEEEFFFKLVHRCSYIVCKVPDAYCCDTAPPTGTKKIPPTGIPRDHTGEVIRKILKRNRSTSKRGQWLVICLRGVHKLNGWLADYTNDPPPKSIDYDDDGYDWQIRDTPDIAFPDEALPWSTLPDIGLIVDGKGKTMHRTCNFELAEWKRHQWDVEFVPYEDEEDEEDEDEEDE